MFSNHFLTDVEEGLRFRQAGGFFHDAFQRIGNIADDFDLGLVIFIDVCRHGVDVDDVALVKCHFAGAYSMMS